MDEIKKLNIQLVILSLIVIALVVLNLFMVVKVRDRIDSCNFHWKEQMIEHMCITKTVVDQIPIFDMDSILLVPNNDTGLGDYEWQ